MKFWITILLSIFCPFLLGYLGLFEFNELIKTHNPLIIILINVLCCWSLIVIQMYVTEKFLTDNINFKTVETKLLGVAFYSSWFLVPTGWLVKTLLFEQDLMYVIGTMKVTVGLPILAILIAVTKVCPKTVDDNSSLIVS